MLKAAVIGTGGISSAHLGYLQSRDDVQIAALCDINEENLARRQKEYGGEGYTDFETMLDRVRPDAVWVCTPPTVRREPLLACARRGLPVLCEKPAERDADRAARLADELAALNAHVQIGYLFRSMPSVQKLRELLADDAVHVIQSYYGCPMSLKRSTRSWFYDKALSGGALVDQATHNLDLLRYLFGEVTAVYGTATNPVFPKEPGYTIEEAFALSMVFTDGTVGAHCHSWVADAWRNEMTFSGQKRFYRFAVSRGHFTWHEGEQTHTFQQENRPIHHFQNDVFLDAVVSGDWGRIPSDYADAAATLRLTLACDRAVSDGTARV